MHLIASLQLLTLISVESAPTSPNDAPKGGAPSGVGKSSSLAVAIPYPMPVLSSSAPELEGMWTEVKRRQRELRPPKPKQSEVKILIESSAVTFY